MSHAEPAGQPSKQPFNGGHVPPLNGTGRPTRPGTYGAGFAASTVRSRRSSKYPPGVFASPSLLPPAEQVSRLIEQKERELAELRAWQQQHERPAPPPPTAAADGPPPAVA